MVQVVERLLPLFPLERVVLFPGMPLPLHVFEERYKLMIGTCQVTDGLFGVLLVRSGREVGEPAETVGVGCTARILEIDRLPDGRMHLLTVGEHRFRLLAPPRVMPEGYLVGDAAIEVATASSKPVTADAVSDVAAEFDRYRELMRRVVGREVVPSDSERQPLDPLGLSYRVAGALRVSPEERQELLEVDDVGERLRQELALLRRESRTMQLMLSAKGTEKTIGPFSTN